MLHLERLFLRGDRNCYVRERLRYGASHPSIGSTCSGTVRNSGNVRTATRRGSGASRAGISACRRLQEWGSGAHSTLALIFRHFSSKLCMFGVQAIHLGVVVLQKPLGMCKLQKSVQRTSVYRTCSVSYLPIKMVRALCVTYSNNVLTIYNLLIDREGSSQPAWRF